MYDELEGGERRKREGEGREEERKEKKKREKRGKTWCFSARGLQVQVEFWHEDSFL